MWEKSEFIGISIIPIFPNFFVIYGIVLLDISFHERTFMVIIIIIFVKGFLIQIILLLIILLVHIIIIIIIIVYIIIIETVILGPTKIYRFIIMPSSRWGVDGLGPLLLLLNIFNFIELGQLVYKDLFFIFAFM